jgi:ABC-2 type transport system ATP-binding protein
MMTGLLRPTEGRVVIDGIDLAADPVAAKRRMGLVPDEPFVYPKLTGVEYLRFVGELYGVGAATMARRVPELLEMFELLPWGGELVESYSHGMRQKLVLAGILLHEPKALVLDEPMVGLDPKSGRLVKDIFARLAQRGTAIFMCTHVLEIAEKLCGRIGVMLGGRMIACGTLEELRAQSRRDGTDLEDIFLSLTGGAEYSTLLRHL